MNAENILPYCMNPKRQNFRLKRNCKTFVILPIILIKLTVTLVLLVLWKLQIWERQTLHFTLSKTSCYHQIISCCQLIITCSNFLASVLYWEGRKGEENFIVGSRCYLFCFVLFISLCSSSHRIN